MDTLVSGRLLWFSDHPGVGGDAACQYLPEGALVISAGRIVAVGNKTELQALYPHATQCDYGQQLILPGFIDTHTHLPQVGVIASYGEQLLDWLNDYTFPAERAFSDAGVCTEAASFYLRQLFQNGTTTALVYGTVHPQSVEAFFQEASRYDARMICGKALMDRHAPTWLQDTAASGYQDSQALIARWHGQGRLAYAVTPRFAPTSTAAQLTLAGQLLREHDGLYLQTHLSENRAEIDWVKALYPDARDYLDVYDRFGLLGPRSIFGHGIHLQDAEIARLAETGSGIAFCPSSNLFLGSGLLDLQRLEAAGVSVSMATDVGAGTSFSMLYTLNQAYKILQLQGQSLHPLAAFYRITLGNARALQLDHCIGKLEAGYEADFVVLDTHATALGSYRSQRCHTLAEELFCAQILGDDRWIAATWVAGKAVYTREAQTA